MKIYQLILIALVALGLFQNCAEKRLSLGSIQRESVENPPVDQTPKPIISSGYLNACYLNKGSLKCWGYNQYGELGNGMSLPNDPRSTATPQQVVGMDKDVSFVEVGVNQACAIRNGGLFCWGLNHYGQLGNGKNSTQPTVTPNAVEGMDTDVIAVNVGYYSACAIKKGGSLFCWGSNNWGQLGNGTQNDRNVPGPVYGMDTDVTAVSLSDGDDDVVNHTCAIKSGKLFCWGFNSQGQVGDGTTSHSSIPIEVVGMDANVTAVATGGYHTCAIKSGKLYCWGNNGNGELGIGDNTNRQAPTAVTGLLADKTVTAVKTGKYHTCATAEAKLYCWGHNGYGQSGVGMVTSDEKLGNRPLEVKSLVGSIDSFSASFHSSYAIIGNNLYGWGRNNFYQLGLSTSNNPFPSPMKVLEFE